MSQPVSSYAFGCRYFLPRPRQFGGEAGVLGPKINYLSQCLLQLVWRKVTIYQC